MAAGGGHEAAALTRTGLTGTDDSTAQGNQLVPVEPEVWQQQGSKLQPMGTMRRGNGNVTGGVPFLATPITAREGKGPDSDMTSGNLVTSDVAYAPLADPGRVGQGRNTNYAPLGGQVTHALTAEGADASEDGTGRGTPIVAFGETGGDIGLGDDLSPPVRTGTGGSRTAVAAAAVRRLTPVECERLQGYPDGWTVTSGGREQSDSARYRQLGNSIAVPVFAWVARRLVACENR